jgi:hypothetical protein
VDELHQELLAIVEDARRRGFRLVALGAFAVRAYLKAPHGRLTHDIDLLVARSDLESLRTALEERGYRVYDTGTWWRGERPTQKGRYVIDIAVDEVVDAAAFDTYPLDPGDAVEIAEPGAAAIPVPSLEDILALKLLAHRDKDVLDLIALLRDAGERVRRDAFLDRVEHRDLEIPIRRGYLAVSALVQTGELLALWRARHGEDLDPELLRRAMEHLEGLCP